MELYVPICARGGTKFTNVPLVFEIYENLDPIYKDIRKNDNTIWAAVFGGFSLLYVLLYGIVLQASKKIKEQTASLVESREQLVQADKLVTLGTLSAGVAHEINSPNQNILTNIGLLKKYCEHTQPILDKHFAQFGDFRLNGVTYLKYKERLPDMLNAIRDSSNRISLIVSDLGDFARYKSAQQSYGVDLNDVVNSATGLARNMLKKSTHKFTKRLSDEIPSIRGNSQRLEQVVVNLIINSCQALPDQSKSITISTTHDVHEKVNVLCVEDQGEGITKDDMKRIFDPFFTTRRKEGGTGLGLAISRSIVEAHGGTIQYVSKPGNGTKAIIKLPYLTNGSLTTSSTSVK